jgi:hypothetical protein
MSNEKAKTNGTTETAAPTDKQIIERNAKDGAPPPAAPTVRPWTSRFLLPSVRFRERKPAAR